MTYLQSYTDPDFFTTVHQCARFFKLPRLSHERIVRTIVKYFHGTSNRRIMYTPDASRGLEYFVDAHFAGSWDKADIDNEKM